MAIAFPAGDCYFKRPGLDTEQPEGFHASDKNQFHGRMIIEFIWNWPAYHDLKECNYPHGWRHPRSKYYMGNADWWATKYGQWGALPLNYGPTETDIRRRCEHNLCTNANRFRDVEKGGALEPWFMAVPMPTKEERWVWIDLTGWIRAIYFPVSYSASPEYPDLCTYVHINFTRMKQAEIWCGGDKQEIILCDATKGLRRSGSKTLGLDVYGLIQLLSLPRQLRRKSPFQSKLMKVVNYKTIKTVPLERTYWDKYDFDWPTIANANFGVDVHWRPVVQSAWWETWVKDAVTLALTFIPVSGPFLAVAFPLGWTLIRDPKAFIKELRAVLPYVDLPARFIEACERESMEMRKYLPDDWQKLDLPAQGTTDDSTIGVTLPGGSIGVGDKPEPDGQRAESAEVFPNAQTPQKLDPEIPKLDSFLQYDLIIKAEGKTATWTPAEGPPPLEAEFDPATSDELSPQDAQAMTQYFSE